MVNTAVGKNLALLHRQMPEAVKHQVRIAAIYNGRTDDGTVLLKKLIWIQAGQRVQRMVHDRASLPVQRLTVELSKQGRGSSAENHAEGGVTSLLFQSELGIEFGEFSAKARLKQAGHSRPYGALRRAVVCGKLLSRNNERQRKRCHSHIAYLVS